jgi:Icc-related predicted phosphoesterase
MPLIRITADIHADVPAMEMLAANAGDYALTIVAGDLMDMFAMRAGLDRQREVIYDWMTAMVEDGRWFAWCDGNHDDGLRMPDSPHIIGPTQTRLIEGLAVITCLPWDADLWNPHRLREPRQLSDEAKVPWIVVSHRPPPSSALGVADFTHAYHVEFLLQENPPDYYACGHIHQAPYHHGCCSQLCGKTTVLNPGRRSADINLIELNPASGAMVWDG